VVCTLIDLLRCALSARQCDVFQKPTPELAQIGVTFDIELTEPLTGSRGRRSPRISLTGTVRFVPRPRFCWDTSRPWSVRCG